MMHGQKSIKLILPVLRILHHIYKAVTKPNILSTFTHYK
jgi:hypothetical protein